MLHDLQKARATLGVREGATVAEITRAWRRLAKRYHPDRKGGDGIAMSRVNQARDVLLAPQPPPAIPKPPKDWTCFSQYEHRRAM